MLEPLAKLIKNLTLIIGGGVGALLLAVGTIVFFASVIAFLAARAKGDGKGLEDAKNRLLLSVVGLFFMVAVWGIVRFLELNILGNSIRCVDTPQTIFGAGATQRSGCSGSTYYGNTSNSTANCRLGVYCVEGANTNNNSNSSASVLSQPYQLTPVPNASNSGTNCTDFRTCTNPGQLDN